MKYEVMISPCFHSLEIEADSEEEAIRRFVQITRDNLDVEHCEGWPIEEEGG